MKERYYSLDIFRGATVAFMILVNNQPGPTYLPLDHAVWHGCTPTDLVFPFFLFAVGNAMAFVMPTFEQAGTRYFLQKVFKRTILIFFIGLFLNWSPFFRWDHNLLVPKGWTWLNNEGQLSGVRILGVLQRIALSYFFASIIVYFCKIRGAFVFSSVLLLAYWGLCATFGSASDPFSLSGYFGTTIDLKMLGAVHMYHGEGIAFDPEGLAGTLTAIVQVIFGYFIGQYIQQKGKTYEMLANLFIVATLLVFSGFCWDLLFPINKKIWSSSFVLYTSGLAIYTLCTVIFLVEFKGSKSWWTKFFDVFGKNPLFIFVLSGFLPRVLALVRIQNGLNKDAKPLYTSPFGWLYEHFCKPISTDLRIGSLFYALLLIAFYWLIVYTLDKKKIYIKV